VERISGGVDVGHGDHPAAQQHGDLVRVDPVVLGLAAMDCFHVEGVPEDKGDVLPSAEVGKPVPGEEAFHGDDDVLAVRGDDLEEGLRSGGHVLVHEHVPRGVEDADVHGACMQIDSAVVSVMLCVESDRRSPLCPRWGGSELLARPSYPAGCAGRRPG